MRFPSVTALVQRAYVVLLRFPWTLAAAALAAVAACITPYATGTVQEDWGRIAMCAMLAVPLTVAVTLAGERRDWSAPLRLLLQVAGVALIYVFYLHWRGPEDQWEMIHYLQLSAALHLLVAVLPFIRGPESGAFWEYNRQLLLAFLRAGIFSAVLFVGLAIAIGALDKLFGVPVPGRLYMQLWLVIALLVNTWIFLAALPDDATRLEGEYPYPRALAIFTQYVLTPLVAVYLLLLTGYLAKIVITRQWPSGWIGWLVGSVAVAGILGFLLVQPLRHARDQGWIAIYARWLFIGLVPAAVMLVLALHQRIDPYGLTELRVIALALAVWLLAIAVMYTWRPGTGIRVIPLSLAALLLLMMTGPLGTRTLAVRSQAHRLDRLLAGFTPGTPRDARPEDRQEIASAARFLIERHATGELERTFGTKVTGKWNRAEIDSTAKLLLATRGIEYEAPSGRGGRYRVARRPATRPVEIDGYTWMLHVASRDTGTVMLGSDSLRDAIRYWSDSVPVRLAVAGHGDTLRFDLAPVIAALSNSGASEVPWTAGLFVIRAAQGSLRGALSVDFMDRYEATAPGSWSGTLLLARSDTAQRAAEATGVSR